MESIMANDILTPSTLARHIQVKTQHDYWERLLRASRDGIMLALSDVRNFSQDGYVAVIIEYQRTVFRHKRLMLEYPELYEQFSEAISVSQLRVTGPAEPPVKGQSQPPPKYTPIGPLAEPASPKGYVRSLIEQNFGPDEELLDKLEGAKGLRRSKV
jgi:hypothetical protein